EHLDDRGEHRLPLGVSARRALGAAWVLDEVHRRSVPLDDEGVLGDVAVVDPPGREAVPCRPAAEVPSVLAQPAAKRVGRGSGSAYPPGMAARTPKTTAAPWVPAHGGLAALQRASKDCQGCDLWRNATQTVFGEGPTHPDLMLVGEQPGDKEDVA